MYCRVYKKTIFHKITNWKKHNRIGNEINLSDEEIDNNSNFEIAHNIGDDISATENVPILVVNGTINHANDYVEDIPVDIWAQQTSLNKRFSTLTLS